MQLSDKTLRLVRAVADNDLTEAKQAAEALLVEDRTRKNRGAISDLMTRLHAVPEEHLCVPDELSDFLRMYEPSDTVLSVADEKKVLDQIGLSAEASPAAFKAAFLTGPYLLGIDWVLAGISPKCICQWLSIKTGLTLLVLDLPKLIVHHHKYAALKISNVFQFVRGTPCILLIDGIDCGSLYEFSKTNRWLEGNITTSHVSLFYELRDMYDFRGGFASHPAVDEHIIFASYDLDLRPGPPRRYQEIRESWSAAFSLPYTLLRSFWATPASDRPLPVVTLTGKGPTSEGVHSSPCVVEELRVHHD